MHVIGTCLSILVSFICQLVQDLLLDSDWFLVNLLELELFYLCTTVFAKLYAYFYLSAFQQFGTIEPFHQFAVANKSRNFSRLLIGDPVITSLRI